MRGRVLLAYVTCCAIWGSTWMVIRVGLQDLPPFLFAAARMALAAAVLTPLALAASAGRATRRDAPHIALCGLLQIGLSYALVFAAERYLDSGLTAVLFASYAIWAGLLAHALLPDEPFTPRRAAAAGLGLLGVGVLELPALRAWLGASRPSAVYLASLLPVGAAICSALASVWIKRRLGAVAPAVNLWGQTLVGSSFLALLHLAFESRATALWSARAVGALLYLAIPGTVVGFLALLWIIPRVPVATIGAIPLIDTLVAVALGAAVLGEPLGVRLVAGAFLVLSGVALASTSGAAEPATPAS